MESSILLRFLHSCCCRTVHRWRRLKFNRQLLTKMRGTRDPKWMHSTRHFRVMWNNTFAPPPNYTEHRDQRCCCRQCTWGGMVAHRLLCCAVRIEGSTLTASLAWCAGAHVRMCHKQKTQHAHCKVYKSPSDLLKKMKRKMARLSLCAIFFCKYTIFCFKRKKTAFAFSLPPPSTPSDLLRVPSFRSNFSAPSAPKVFSLARCYGG